jgi:hypothetical protein
MLGRIGGKFYGFDLGGSCRGNVARTDTICLKTGARNNEEE